MWAAMEDAFVFQYSVSSALVLAIEQSNDSHVDLQDGLLIHSTNL